MLKNINAVIKKEFGLIGKRRKRTGHPYFNDDDAAPVDPSAPSQKDPNRKKKKPCTTLIGLALSGGGIRSAVTNLGLLQGLSERGILPGVDYISTVSGGGYIGACLASLLSNNDRSQEKSKINEDPYSFSTLQKSMFATGWLDDPFREDKSYPEDEPLGKIQMDHIRTRASYLVPRARHFSSTVIRAVGSVFISTFMSLLWFILVITALTSCYMAAVSYVAPYLEITPAGRVIDGNTEEVLSNSSKGQAPLESHEKSEDHLESVKETLNIIADYAQTPFVKFTDIDYPKPWKIGLSIFFLGTFSLMLVSKDVCRRLKGKYLFCFTAYIFLLLSTLGPGYFVFQKVLYIEEFRQGAILVVPPLFAGGILFGAWLVYIWISRHEGTWNLAQRNQLHQLMGILVVGLILALLWTVLPGFMNIDINRYNTLLLIAFGTGLRYFVIPRKSKTKITGIFPEKIKEWLLGLCTLLFVFAAVVYTGNSLRQFFLDNAIWPGHSAGLNGASPLLAVLGISLVLLFVFSFFVDVNKISPHYFYRDRLAETFLQTIKQDGSCLRDDTEMKLADLHGNEQEGCAVRGPYLLMNATLNLTAATDLKAFNRKSDIFTFSRLFVGSEKTGFIHTDKYEVDDGTLKLARAMAISGAAISSVMGMNTSLARSFACTVLGVRFGYWLPNFKHMWELEHELDSVETVIQHIQSDLLHAKNTEELELRKRMSCCEKVRKKLNRKTKRATSFYWCNFLRLFKELIGHTTAQEEEIYLSDGGHSGDNLGIIPLLQRRVRLLIVSDSECDPSHSFNSFNSSVRNAYVDEGIQIKICLDGLRKNSQGFTRDKFAVGRIIYPENKDQENWLVLFKNTMTGKESAPIINYKEKSEDFPHESTSDQFFTEEQFESYRALGRFSALDAFNNTRSWLNGCRESSKVIDMTSIVAAFSFLNTLSKKYKPVQE